MEATVDQPTTTRERQQLAIHALADLAEYGLPDATWTIGSGLNAGHLNGQISAFNHPDPAERRAAICRWAELLDAEPSEGLHATGTTVTVQVVGEHLGVHVNVWTHLPVEDLTPAVAEGETR